MKKLKKPLKYILIFTLVVASILATLMIFNKNYKIFKQDEVYVSEITDSDLKTNFNKKLNEVANSIKDDNPIDNRFDIIFTTKLNLDNALNLVTTYYVNDDEVIKDIEIAEKLKLVNANMDLAIKMADEYLIKSNSIYYKKHLGVNDLYNTTTDFIVNYADLIALLNNRVSLESKSMDIKFAMIDAYCKVCADVCSTEDFLTDGEGKGWLKIENETNLEFFNRYFKVENAQLKLSDMFSSVNNKFIGAYLNCDKDNFIKNIKTLCDSVGSYSENLTMEKKAAYYFKEVYGV